MIRNRKPSQSSPCLPKPGQLMVPRSDSASQSMPASSWISRRMPATTSSSRSILPPRPLYLPRCWSSARALRWISKHLRAVGRKHIAEGGDDRGVRHQRAAWRCVSSCRSNARSAASAWPWQVIAVSSPAPEAVGVQPPASGAGSPAGRRAMPRTWRSCARKSSTMSGSRRVVEQAVSRAVRLSTYRRVVPCRRGDRPRSRPWAGRVAGREVGGEAHAAGVRLFAVGAQPVGL